MEELFDLFEAAYNEGSRYEYDNESSFCDERQSKTFEEWLEENKQTIIKIIESVNPTNSSK